MLKYNNTLSVTEYCELRSAVEWPSIIEEQAEAGLNNSDFIIACREDTSAGCARIFGDKGYIAYLADVMVKPEYQKQGIGKHLINECILYIDNQLKAGWRILNSIDYCSANVYNIIGQSLGRKERSYGGIGNDRKRNAKCKNVYAV